MFIECSGRMIAVVDKKRTSFLFFKKRIKSEDLTEDDIYQLRRKIGMVFQSYDLFPHLNVIKNILLGPKHAHELKLDITMK